MKSCKWILLFLVGGAALVASAEVQVIDGVKYECKDGLCRIVEEGENVGSVGNGGGPRIAQGYMTADEFVAFLENREVKSPFAETGVWLTLLLVLLGGLAMNLTPCVLPMIPINLIVIGKSAVRGAWYGLGIALAYGALGVAAAVGGLAFGTIQGSPWFNAVVALVFAGLALALFDVWMIDFSRFRGGGGFVQKRKGFRFSAVLVSFGMGVLSAVLAGACVAPILISVLLLTGKLYVEGNVLALVFPFVLGLGMALPWPFLGAGMKVLPRPGAWMKWVNRLFGAVVLGFAAWYGWLAWKGFLNKGEADSCPLQNKEGSSLFRSGKDSASPLSGEDAAFPFRSATPMTLNSQLSMLNSKSAKPILVDCWASWCKNCAAMDRVMEEPKVKRVLEACRVIRVQAEDISELRKIKGFESIRGLPAFVIFD